jgi:hypothetical protein
MAEKIDVWKFAAKPSGKQIDRERETVHLGKQRHDEGRVRTEAAPVAQLLRFEETVGESNKNEDVEGYQAPYVESQPKLSQFRSFTR